MDNARKPWSPDDIAELSDLLDDGFPRRSIAERLGRSVHAVQGMARKLGARIRRGKTVAFQNQIDEQAFSDLCALAKQKHTTPCTMGRILLELTLKSPVFLAALLDDFYDDRRQLTAKGVDDRQPATLSAAAVPAAVSVLPLSSLFCPQLSGCASGAQLGGFWLH
jgi:hypothetical protein